MIAEPVIQVDIIHIQLERDIRTSLAAGEVAVAAIVALVIGQAFRPGVVSLVRQTVAQPLLGAELERIVVLDAGGCVEPDLARACVLESRVARQVGTWTYYTVRVKETLSGEVDCRQVVCVLSDVSRLQGGRAPEQALDGDVPLVGNGRPVVRIGHVDSDSGKA